MKMKLLITLILVIQANLMLAQNHFFKSDGIYYEDSTKSTIANGEYSFKNSTYYSGEVEFTTNGSVVYVLDSGELVSKAAFHAEDQYQHYKLAYENNKIKDSVYTFLNKKDILNGFYVKSIEEVSFIDGERNGLSIRLIIDDTTHWVRETCSYLNGKPHGLYLTLKRDGKPYKEIFFKHGIKDGFERKYYNDINQLEYEFLYHSGKANGVSKQWWRNGNLKSKVYFKKGTLEGKATLFLKDGRKAVEQLVENGKAIQTEQFVRNIEYFEKKEYLLEPKDSTHQLIKSY